MAFPRPRPDPSRFQGERFFPPHRPQTQTQPRQPSAQTYHERPASQFQEPPQTQTQLQPPRSQGGYHVSSGAAYAASPSQASTTYPPAPSHTVQAYQAMPAPPSYDQPRSPYQSRDAQAPAVHRRPIADQSHPQAPSPAPPYTPPSPPPHRSLPSSRMPSAQTAPDIRAAGYVGADIPLARERSNQDQPGTSPHNSHHTGQAPYACHCPSTSAYNSHGPGHSPYDRGFENVDTAYRPSHRQRNSDSSRLNLIAAADTPGYAADGDLSTLSLPYDDRAASRASPESPYHHFIPGNSQVQLGAINPMDIADDEDDHFVGSRAGAGVGAGAGAGAAAGIFRGIKSRDASGNYGQVPGGSKDEKGSQSEWLQGQKHGNKRLKWIVAAVITGVVVLAIVGGVVGVVVSQKKSSSTSSMPTNSQINGQAFTINSPEVKAVLNNANLHRVFPGIDYTPLNAQYPACLTNPPAQNNVTLDVAVLSQLTPIIRLYGTDCNQTQMVLNAIKDLDMQSSMKIWLGVWLENNATTNARQLAQMYDVLDTYGANQIEGIIIGNEVLFRQDMTATQLIDVLSTAKSKLSSMGINLPVTTSDIGSVWTAQLAAAVDVVMANIHPFFGGVPAAQAASWTWSYWQTNDVAITNGLSGNIGHTISETGWPSAGGNDCGTGNTCSSSTVGAVAGIDEMNTYLSEWVCSALANGTSYFWFEAFDEPWKVEFNTATEQWEDKWGLMDVNRDLKAGLTIPDCGGQTASASS